MTDDQYLQYKATVAFLEKVETLTKYIKEMNGQCGYPYTLGEEFSSMRSELLNVLEKHSKIILEKREQI